MKRNKIYFKIFVVVLSLLSISLASYINAERMIKYVLKTSKSNMTQTGEIIDNINTHLENIPLSSNYKMTLEGNFIMVYDENHTPVYKSELKSLSNFTESDRKQLQRDGIYYTVRSELVEDLIYINY